MSSPDSTRSPARTRRVTAVSAAMPEVNASARAAPSSSAIWPSSSVRVGLPLRV